MPNTLLEAIRAGLPSIGTMVGAVPDILGEADGAPACGLLVEPGDVPDLALAMQKLINEPDLRRSLANAAHIRAETYRTENRMNIVESIYMELLHARELV